jgi:UDP-N-acetylmuramoyl-tripeptide--D-alanyl-D-alanine ligase
MKRQLTDFAVAMRGALVGANRDFSGVSIDSRTCAAGDLFVALKGDRFDGHDYVDSAVERGAVAVVVERDCGVSVPQIIVSDALVALQAAGAAWRRAFDIPVVGVAGSNGKTTTKGMIAAILGALGPCHATKGTLNNHIGVPLTLLALTAEHRTAVIEIGANHPGEVAMLVGLAAPTHGVVTNAGEEHLEGFGSLEGAARAEGELFAGLAATATAILNADDAFAALWREMNRAETVVEFGLHGTPSVTVNGSIQCRGTVGEYQVFDLVCPAGTATVTLGLMGHHNVQNALAAAAVAWSLGCSAEQIADGLANVAPVKGRLEVKRTRDGACLIDDTYNANPSSLDVGLAALAQVAGERLLVLGNMAELGSASVSAHRKAGEVARAAGVQRLYTLGDLAAEAAASFGEGAEVFEQLDPLAERLRGELRSGMTVLIKGSRVNRLERLVDALVQESNLGV